VMRLSGVVLLVVLLGGCVAMPVSQDPIVNARVAIAKGNWEEAFSWLTDAYLYKDGTEAMVLGKQYSQIAEYGKNRIPEIAKSDSYIKDLSDKDSILYKYLRYYESIAPKEDYDAIFALVEDEVGKAAQKKVRQEENSASRLALRSSVTSAPAAKVRSPSVEADRVFGIVVDVQTQNESTYNTGAGASLGSAAAQAAYIDGTRSRSLQTWNYSAKKQLGAALLGAFLGAALDTPTQISHRVRYSVKTPDGTLHTVDKVQGNTLDP